MLSSQKLSAPTPRFWDDITHQLSESLRACTAKTKRTNLISSLHVLDRIAASGEIPEGIDELLRILSATISDLAHTSKTSLVPVDAVMATRAMLLLGWQGPFFLTAHHLRKSPLSTVVSLGGLAAQLNAKDLIHSIGTDLVSRLSQNMSSSIPTKDLVSVSEFLCISYPQPVVARMKSLGTELVRRIEAGYISPHSAVRVIELFSGHPPNGPIHPLLLQACYSLLLTGRSYRSLSTDELARCFHAMVQSEIENVVLSRCLLGEYCGREESVMDPRVSLRMLAAASISKSDFPKDYIHLVSRRIDSDWSARFETETVTTALLNLLYNGVCMETVNWVGRMAKMDSSLFFLRLASSRMHCHVGVKNILENPIPPGAIEVIEKSNPAFPRSDVKKKRLVKRIDKFAQNAMDREGVVDEGMREICSERNSEAMLFPRLSKSLTHPELIDSVTDILSGMQFVNLRELRLRELREMDALIDSCLSVVTVEDGIRVGKISAEKKSDSVESGVRGVLENMGHRVTEGFVTASLNRIGLVLDS
jgi:hypothetical protein